MLGDFVDRMGLGEVSVSPFDVVQPDILFVSKSRRHISTQNNIQGAPDLVIEVLSPSNASRDWGTKGSMYEEHGVLEYWVVDPDARQVWVMGRTDDTLVEVGSYKVGDVLVSPLLTGFTAALTEVFQAPW
jgi:Uma2 family endonuclease